MGRSEDAAVTESARTQLKSAIHPPDDPAGGQVVGNPMDERAFLKFLDALTVFSC